MDFALAAVACDCCPVHLRPGMGSGGPVRRRPSRRPSINSARSLRSYNAEAQPRMRRRVEALTDKKGWTGEDREERALTLSRGRTPRRTRHARQRTPDQGRSTRSAEHRTGPRLQPSWPRLKAASLELLAVMKAKAAYLDDKIEREVGPAPVQAAPQRPRRRLPKLTPAEPRSKLPARPQSGQASSRLRRSRLCHRPVPSRRAKTAPSAKPDGIGIPRRSPSFRRKRQRAEPRRGEGRRLRHRRRAVYAAARDLRCRRMRATRSTRSAKRRAASSGRSRPISPA